MKSFLFVILAALVLGSPCFAISEAEFQKLYQSSAALREADKLMNQTWKEVNANIPAADKKTLLKFQREWVKTGRDETAAEYMRDGYAKACAYAIATASWTKDLKVFEYNFNLSEEDQGRAKAEGAFWDPDEDIPADCRKK